MDGKAKRSLATEEYSVPLTVRHHVDFITPTVQFDATISKRSPKKRAVPSIKSMLHKTNQPIQISGYQASSSSPLDSTTAFDPTDLSICNQFITTECLRALYNMPNGTLAQSSITIVEYSPQSFIPTDLGQYLATMDPWIPSKTQPLVEFVDGAALANNPADSDESNLDLQLAVPLGESFCGLYQSDLT